jgi:hypothetical protein
MGNRGVLHNAAKQIVAFSQSPRWITCALSFRGIRRNVFAPGRYSELFFLDEATSLAAGHRPCAECRRSRYREFCTAWLESGHHAGARQPLRADNIDRVLHLERVKRVGVKKTFDAALSSLPEGAFVDLGGRPYLLWGGRLRPWSFSGYGPARPVTRAASKVKVLTPESIIQTIRAGFMPQVHKSADGDARVRGDIFSSRFA